MANEQFDLDVRVTQGSTGDAQPMTITPTITVSLRVCTRLTCRTCTCVSCPTACPIGCVAQD